MNAHSMFPVAVPSSPFADLVETLTSVHSLINSTLVTLERSCQEMRNRGLPPGYSMVLEIGECHRAFIRLRAELMRRAEKLGLDVPPLERVADLQDVARLLSHYQQETSPFKDYLSGHDQILPVQESEPTINSADSIHETGALPTEVEKMSATPELFLNSIENNAEISGEEAPIETIPELTQMEVSSHSFTLSPTNEDATAELIRDAALSILERVLSLRLKDAGEFAPLTACQSQARSLREAIINADRLQIPVEAHQIAACQHPFSSLLVVVSGVGDMEDEHWANHHSQISESFGRPMAVAAARGKLFIPD